ncbi:dTDP-4-dehydrorhamnose reductase family protein [Bacillus sp. CGMCC 1.16607]|uniref:dTDP-4-dehydrorhamnose reductase family protein n=1 Tax=Bacillus sp. CGMCC 1.16607 TaxID=3351842 RepID=UPI0036343171
MEKQRILILGVTGMLGHTLFSELSNCEKYEVYGTARVVDKKDNWFNEKLLKNIRTGVDATNFDSIIRALASVQPDIVINCIGLIKQQPIADDPLTAININAQLPHRISLICRTAGARMIHFSTDCVFDGKDGNYIEENHSNAKDLYGRTKYLGEVSYPHSLTIRTSIIGHELKGKYGLIEWFIGQHGKIKGYTKAIYSGFPTLEMAHIISEYIIPNENLNGVYHVSSNPISKYDLLNLVKETYKIDILIEPNNEFKCDRSLNSEKFQKETGYRPPQWKDLIKKMFEDYNKSSVSRKRE